jgi:hypothetical protein
MIVEQKNRTGEPTLGLLSSILGKEGEQHFRRGKQRLGRNEQHLGIVEQNFIRGEHLFSRSEQFGQFFSI